MSDGNFYYHKLTNSLVNILEGKTIELRVARRINSIQSNRNSYDSTENYFFPLSKYISRKCNASKGSSEIDVQANLLRKFHTIRWRRVLLDFELSSLHEMSQF